MKTIPQVAADFDVIADALAETPPRDRLTPAELWLLRQVPADARRAIDVGCGDGLLARVLAARGLDVLGVDLSSRMIELARARTPGSLGVEYRLADVMTVDLPVGTFDVVVSIAMAHHIVLDTVVARLATLVAPGGTLLLQDVMTRSGLWQLPMNAVAFLARRARETVTRSRTPRRVTASYEAHGANERYLDASAVGQTYSRLLPSARVYRHLEWRYSVVWRQMAHA